jgi:hypothetical protein
MISDTGILYVEPSRDISLKPVIDELTRKMTAALRQSQSGTFNPASQQFRVGSGFRGTHECACGVRSSNCDYRLPNGEITNSLCVHYLAWHRDELSPEQLDKVAALEYGEADPTKDELKEPPRVTKLIKGLGSAALRGT